MLHDLYMDPVQCIPKFNALEPLLQFDYDSGSPATTCAPMPYLQTLNTDHDLNALNHVCASECDSDYWPPQLTRLT